jgi:hypothetical protein
VVHFEKKRLTPLTGDHCARLVAAAASNAADTCIAARYRGPGGKVRCLPRNYAELIAEPRIFDAVRQYLPARLMNWTDPSQ